MRTGTLAVKVSREVWDESGDLLVDRLRDVLEVYLNHEDSDFPFEYLADGAAVVDRSLDIDVSLIDSTDSKNKITLTCALSFGLRGAQRHEPLNQGLKIVAFDIDPQTGRIDAEIAAP